MEPTIKLWMENREDNLVPYCVGTAGIHHAETFSSTKTLPFHTSLNTRRTGAVLAISQYILDSGRLVDTRTVQNYTQNTSFPPLTPVILSASLHF